MRTLPVFRPHTGRHAARKVQAGAGAANLPSPRPVVIPADPMAEAEALLHTAVTLDRQEQEGPSWKAVTVAADALDDAVQAWRALDRDDLHWDAVWPHLRDEADPETAAMEKAAEEVTAAAGALSAAMSAHCGTKTTSTGSAA